MSDLARFLPTTVVPLFRLKIQHTCTVQSFQKTLSPTGLTDYATRPTSTCTNVGLHLTGVRELHLHVGLHLTGVRELHLHVGLDLTGVWVEITEAV